MKCGVFLERDGILNRVKTDRYQQLPPLSLREFELNREARRALEKLKAAGFVLLVTTNQPGLSRGYLPRRELDRMHELLRLKFPIDDIFVCPHDEADRCPCRKPRSGMFVEAAFKWHLDLDRSFVVSDKWQDARAAAVVGCTSILVRSPWIGNCHHDFVLPSLGEAVQKILQLQNHQVLVNSQF
ncbi:MAG: HAD-IIIA family hydrolase [Verrucomicrobia bacterium]|nr:HAD-IIIA family hydrolase [Verrucomicrobiota bacterium]